jgi:phosphoglucomutase
MSAYYKKQGKTMVEVLEDIYREFGYYSEKLISIVLEGVEGSKRIGRMMEEFRKNPLETIGDMKLEKTVDYLLDETGNSKSNVLKYYLDDGSWYAVRPSGTEPKIKLYIYSKDEDKKESSRKTEIIENKVIEKLYSVE